jgi:hypothetical protein
MVLIEEKITSNKNFIEKIKAKNIILIAFLIFLFSFLIRVYPILIYGYPVGWLDSEVHSYRMSLMVTNPSLFFNILFGIEIKPNIYPYNDDSIGTSFWTTNTNPFPIYLLGGFLNFFVKELLAGYITACILSSLGIVVVFYFLYGQTKSYLISLASSVFLLLNPGEIWYWQQGAWTPLGGIFLYPLAIYFIFDYFNDKISWKIPFILTSIVLLFYPPIVFILLLSLTPFFMFKLKNKQIKPLLKKLFVILSATVIVSIYFILLSSKSYFLQTKPFSEAFFSVFNDMSSPYYGAIYLTPIMLYILTILGILYSLLRKDGKALFYVSGVILLLFFTFILIKLNPAISFLIWITRLYEIFPQFTAIMSGLFIFYLKEKFIISNKNKIVFTVILLLFLFIYSYSSFEKLNFVMNRHSILNDYKYNAMLWIRKNTSEASKILLFNPYEINGYDWASFFYRKHLMLSVNDVDSIFNQNNINSSYFNYDYVVINYYPIKINNKIVSFIDLSKLVFTNYTEVFSNKEVTILKKS